MNKKIRRGAGVFLLCINCATGLVRRYKRTDAPRWAGDETQVEVTHDAEVEMPNAGEYKRSLDLFRTEPDKVAQG